MDIRADEISKLIRDQIGSFTATVDVAEVGTVIAIGDGISRVHGLERAMAGEMLEFPHGVFGIALNLEEESVGAVLLGDFNLPGALPRTVLGPAGPSVGTRDRPGGAPPRRARPPGIG